MVYCANMVRFVELFAEFESPPVPLMIRALILNVVFAGTAPPLVIVNPTTLLPNAPIVLPTFSVTKMKLASSVKSQSPFEFGVTPETLELPELVLYVIGKLVDFVIRNCN